MKILFENYTYYQSNDKDYNRKNNMIVFNAPDEFGNDGLKYIEWITENDEDVDMRNILKIMEDTNNENLSKLGRY